MKKLWKRLPQKTVIGLLVLTMVLSGVCFLPTYADEVKAANDTVWAEQLETGNYQTEAPKPADEAHKDWLFAGWYEDPECTKVISTKPAGGEKYAKFVPAEVLSVKCQVTEGTTALTTDNVKLRIVSTVDSRMYSSVGFDIVINGKERSYETAEVYGKIVANEGGVAYGYEPKVFHTMSKYFITATIVNIPQKAFDTGIRITPYWKTMDGTKVSGVGRYARVEDSYRQIANVPVRLYSEEEVAAGYLEVEYDGENFEYIGYDTGTVFEEMDASAVAVDGKNVVRLVGNVEKIDVDKKADGMYANLRFELKSDLPDGNTTFPVLKKQFCDKTETNKEPHLAAVQYQQIGNWSTAQE